MRFELSGTEKYTLEIEGRLDRAAAERRVLGALAREAMNLRSDDAGVEVSVLFFAMEGLRMTSPTRAPFGFDYGEALWRIGVSWRGAPAWLAIACDIDRALVRTTGAWMVRYPVRPADIEVTKDHVRVSTPTETMRIGIETPPGASTPDATAPRPVLVPSGDRVYRIPWREDAAPKRHEASIHIEDGGLASATFGGEPHWHATGLVHEGRVHRCGVARPID